MKQKRSLKDYWLLFLIILVVTTTIVITASLLYQKRTFEAATDNNKIYYANILVGKIDESFSYIENFANFIGRRISYHNNTNPHFIATILQATQPKIDHKKYDIFTWTFFDFVNPQGYTTAASTLGVIEKPTFIDHKKRSWIITSKLNPWKLQFSKKDVGIVSGEVVIPVGFGITNQNNKFLGIISLGVNVERLALTLQSLINNKTIKYAIFDENYSLILSSNNFEQPDLNNVENYFSIHSYSVKSDNNFTVDNSKYYIGRSHDYPLIVVVGNNEKMLKQEFWSIFFPKITNIIYLTLFFLILLYFFRKRLLNPIVKLSEATNKMSGKQFDVIIPTSEIYEVSLLADSISSLKHFLKKEEELKDQLRIDKEKAQAESIHKNDFLSATAHDLKNLVAGVMGMAELIRYNLNEKAKLNEITFSKEELDENFEHLNDIDKCSSELLDFIHDLLDINQASTGDFKITEENKVNLTDLTRRSIALLETRSHKAKQEIVHNLTKNGQQFYAQNLDSRRIKQILVNLISNAVKYGKPYTKIEIEIKELSYEESEIASDKIAENILANRNFDEKKRFHLLSLMSKKRNSRTPRIAIIIKDHGLGMSEDEIKIALTEYGVIGKPDIRKIDSTGLGLPIVKHLVDAQGGLLEIKSQKNVGTEVRVIF